MAGRGRGVDRDGGFLPLKLIDRADTGARQALLNSNTWALYGAIITMSLSVTGCSLPSASIQVAPLSSIAVTRSLMAVASSGEQF